MHQKKYANILVTLLFVALIIFSVTAGIPGASETHPNEALSEGFTIVVLPDTQKYAKAYPHIFTAQTEWIKEQKDNRNIAFVLHEGDITNDNLASQWRRAKDSMGVLDGQVPYVFTPGNHDTGHRGTSDTRDTSLMNNYFPYSKYSSAATFGGAFEEGRMDNTYHFFNAGGIEWLVLALEFAPRDDVLAWANEVVSDNPDKPAILVTHTYLYSDSTLHGSKPEHKWVPHGYGVSKSPEGANNGASVWNKLVRKHKNFLFVFNGHVLNDGTGRLISRGDNGNLVYQMLANYQMNRNGGDGFLRILEVYPKQKRVVVKTYSPYLDEYKTDTENQFTFKEVNFSP